MAQLHQPELATVCMPETVAKDGSHYTNELTHLIAFNYSKTISDSDTRTEPEAYKRENTQINTEHVATVRCFDSARATNVVSKSASTRGSRVQLQTLTSRVQDLDDVEIDEHASR